jgi:hypothetical protein
MALHAMLLFRVVVEQLVVEPTRTMVVQWPAPSEHVKSNSAILMAGRGAQRPLNYQNADLWNQAPTCPADILLRRKLGFAWTTCCLIK